MQLIEFQDFLEAKQKMIWAALSSTVSVDENVVWRSITVLQETTSLRENCVSSSQHCSSLSTG